MWPLAMSFTEFMTEPSFKCIEDDLDERDLKALSVVSISTGFFFKTLLQNNAKNTLWVLPTEHSKQSG